MNRALVGSDQLSLRRKRDEGPWKVEKRRSDDEEKDAQGRDECRPKRGWPHLHS